MCALSLKEKSLITYFLALHSTVLISSSQLWTLKRWLGDSQDILKLLLKKQQLLGGKKTHFRFFWMLNVIVILASIKSLNRKHLFIGSFVKIAFLHCHKFLNHKNALWVICLHTSLNYTSMERNAHTQKSTITP